MSNYTYIEQIFRNVLSQSLLIEGRFHFLTKSGTELNSDELDKVLNEAENSDPVKFPGAFMPPPVSLGEFSSKDEWEEYRCTMFFLNTTYYTGDGQVSNQIPYTGTSGRPVVKEWDDMKKAATDFIRVVKKVQMGGNADGQILVNDTFRLANDRIVISPVSFMTTKRLSGVRVSFNIHLFNSCQVSDYPGDAEFELP